MAHAHAGLWKLLTNPKVLTAIAASIGMDVVKDKWITSTPDQMADQIRLQLQQQTKYDIAEALMALKRDDKPATDHHYWTYLSLAIGALMTGIIAYQCRQQARLQLQLMHDRANAAV